MKQSSLPKRTIHRKWPGRLSLLLLLPVMTACVINPRVQNTGSPVTDASIENTGPDSGLLARISSLAGGRHEQLDGTSINIVRSYQAASGRACKTVVLTDDSPSSVSMKRVACQYGNRWQFVADVFPQEHPAR